MYLIYDSQNSILNTIIFSQESVYQINYKNYKKFIDIKHI